MPDLRDMTPAQLFDEINADGSNHSDKAHRARMAGLEALRRVQADAAIREAERAASERRIRELTEALDSNCATLIEAGKRIAELEAKVPRWIPVEERLPEPMGPSVFALEAGASWPIRCVYHKGTWYSVDSGSAYDVTHWMPALPSPPAEPAQEESNDGR